MYLPRDLILTFVTFFGTTLTLLEAASKGMYDEQVAEERTRLAMETIDKDDGGAEWANVIREAERDAEHMKHHLRGKADIDFDKMEANELTFHYFQEHDTNDDNHLDGLELLNSIFHVFAVEAHAVGGHLSVQSTIERIAMTIDSTLLEKDVNNDGYLSYTEYMSH